MRLGRFRPGRCQNSSIWASMPETAGAAMLVPERKRYQGATGRFSSSKTAYWDELVSYSLSSRHCAERAERIWEPGATTSGLKRP